MQVGQNVDDYRRTECATHIPALKNFFKVQYINKNVNLTMAFGFAKVNPVICVFVWLFFGPFRPGASAVRKTLTVSVTLSVHLDSV